MTPEQAFEKWYWSDINTVGFDDPELPKKAFLAGQQYQETNQLMVLADIRKAVGDGEGKLMGDELVKRIEGLVNPWRPIETAPKDSRVLVFNAKWRNQEHCGYWSADFREWRGHGAFCPQPTHWMPLPAVPVKSITTEKEEA